MLSIFAIDPEICRNLEWFRYCTEHCHPSKGRVIANWPNSKWYENAYKIIKQSIEENEISPVKAKSLTKDLNKVRYEQLVDRLGDTWNYQYDNDFSQFSYITEIEKEHQREPFSAIVSPEYEKSDYKQHYHPSDLNRRVKVWNTPSGTTITRSPEEFVKAILPMLRLAKNIHFVDGYFDVDGDSLHTENYKKVIEDLVEYHKSYSYRDFPSLTIHCRPDPDELKGKNFKCCLKTYYEALIPEEKSIKVFAWQVNEDIEIKKGNNPFHNRYVLSNHCGVMVGYGTDSYKKETDAPDVLQIVDHEVYQNLWNQIRDGELPMVHIKKENKFEIKGKLKKGKLKTNRY